MTNYFTTYMVRNFTAINVFNGEALECKRIRITDSSRAQVVQFYFVSVLCNVSCGEPMSCHMFMLLMINVWEKNRCKARANLTDGITMTSCTHDGIYCWGSHSTIAESINDTIFLTSQKASNNYKSCSLNQKATGCQRADKNTEAIQNPFNITWRNLQRFISISYYQISIVCMMAEELRKTGNRAGVYLSFIVNQPCNPFYGNSFCKRFKITSWQTKFKIEKPIEISAGIKAFSKCTFNCSSHDLI